MTNQPTLKYLFFDCETTGTNREVHEITSMHMEAYYDGKTQGELYLEFSPSPAAKIHPKALEVQGITEEQLFSRKMTYIEAQQHLEKFLKQHIDSYDKTDKFHMVAYNATFDFNFVYDFWERVCRQKFFTAYFFLGPQCVMAKAAEVLRPVRHNMNRFNLGVIYKLITGKEIPNAHHASSDTKAMRELFFIFDDMTTLHYDNADPVQEEEPKGKYLLVQDDAAPDSIDHFDKRLLEITGYEIWDFKKEGKKLKNGLGYKLDGYKIEYFEDAPGWHLSRTKKKK